MEALALPATTAEVLAYHVHLDVLLLMAVLGVGYELGIRHFAEVYAPRGEPAVGRFQRLLFYSGLGAMFVVSSWPLHDIGIGSLFMAHMVEHLALSLVAPPLLLWGTPWWLLRAVLRPVLPLVRNLTRPIVALLLFNATLGLVHVPSVVELMIRSEAAHFSLHALLFATAIVMWWPVVSPIPDLPELAPFMKMGYLFLQSLVPTVPASFLTLTDEPFYRIYETLPRLGGISAHTDQVVAGLIMKIGGGLLLWGFIAGVFFTWWSDEQRYSATDRPSARSR